MKELEQKNRLPAYPHPNRIKPTWAEKAPMHQARSDLGVAVVNGKIYAIGGLVLKYQDKTTIQSVDVATNEEYDHLELQSANANPTR